MLTCGFVRSNFFFAIVVCSLAPRRVRVPLRTSVAGLPDC
jgi:hypothetical protein